MKIIRRLQPHKLAKGTALTIGNFDGVHSGHAELFRRVVSAAREHNLTATVVTLRPHPKEFFNPNFKLNRISTLRDCIYQMQSCGIDQVCILPFDNKMAGLCPESFIQDIVLNQLNAKQIWVGDDFRFGAKRKGDFNLLKQLGNSLGFRVNDLAEVKNQGVRVSSSGIRAALNTGNISKATQLLGHPLVYSGHIIHGKKLGRSLGFPTMNIRIDGRACALNGILAVWVHGLEKKPLPAVASMGIRPTVEQSDQILLETFIPDWQGNAYGKLLHIEVRAHIRPEQHFDSLELMVTQMHKDTAKAMALLAANQPEISPTGC
jgi:riboflavin kinase/FMN adenylyltransferase